MVRWTPTASIGKNEHVGRRLFDEPALLGATDQPPIMRLLLTNFEETRSDEYSLDRLGASSVDRKVLRYLMPRALAAANAYTKPKAFDGWAWVPARKLMEAEKKPDLMVVASPIPEDPTLLEKDLNGNRFHAHACRPVNMDETYMAYHLRHLFETYGNVERTRRGQERSWLGWVTAKAPFLKPVLARLGIHV